MLDIHPPHEAAHSWKDFFIHMATICLGLLLAIGLEQGVEWIHHRHELKELRESLGRDTEKQIVDAQYYEALATFEIDKNSARMQQTADALRTGLPLAQPMPAGNPPRVQAVTPIDPAWKAATASGLVALVPQGDIVAYSEVDGIVARIKEDLDLAFQVYRKLRGFEREMALTRDPTALPLSKATAEELKTYLSDLDEVAVAFGSLRNECRVLRGADKVILAGERDLGKIEAAEVQFVR